MSLYCSHHDLSSWGKAQPLLGRNLRASCTTSPALLLPLWAYPCLALLPQRLLSASGPDQVCSCSRDSAHGALLAWRLFLQWLHDSFPHSQVSSGITRHRFPQLLSPNIKAVCPSPPLQASVFFSCFIFAQSTSSDGVTVFHSLLGDEELQGSERCAVCCCIPRTRRGPSIW